jgi:hypothetical protein
MMPVTGDLPRTETVPAATAAAKADASFATALLVSGIGDLLQTSSGASKDAPVGREDSKADERAGSSTGNSDIQNLSTTLYRGGNSGVELPKTITVDGIAPKPTETYLNVLATKQDCATGTNADDLLLQSPIPSAKQGVPSTPIVNAGPSTSVPVVTGSILAAASKIGSDPSDKLFSSYSLNSNHLGLANTSDVAGPSTEKKISGIKSLKQKDAASKTGAEIATSSPKITGSEVAASLQVQAANDPSVAAAAQTVPVQKVPYVSSPNSSGSEGTLKFSATGKMSLRGIGKKANEGISEIGPTPIANTLPETNKLPGLTIDNKDDGNGLEPAIAQGLPVLTLHGATNAASVSIAHTAVRADESRVTAAATSNESLISTTATFQRETYGGAAGIISPELGRASFGALTATATSLEVGVATGTHGWLKIRAELDGGVLTTSLSSPTQSGREALHRELPSLTAYLQEERIGVGAVVIRDNSAADRLGGSLAGGLTDQGKQGPKREDNGNPESLSGETWGSSEDDQMKKIWNGLGSSSGIIFSVTAASGGWLNVRV